MIVHARAQVLMGCLARFSLSLLTLRKSFSFTNGPFLALLLIVQSCLLFVVGGLLQQTTNNTQQTSSHVHGLRTLLMRAELPPTQDQLFTVLAWAAGDAALGQHARLAARMAAAVGAPFAAAHRVVDRVHRLGAGVRTNPAMTGPPSLAEADVDPV